MNLLIALLAEFSLKHFTFQIHNIFSYKRGTLFIKFACIKNASRTQTHEFTNSNSKSARSDICRGVNRLCAEFDRDPMARRGAKEMPGKYFLSVDFRDQNCIFVGNLNGRLIIET